jgi:hypothetical protein
VSTMAPRLDLQAILVDITPKVYFQPPPSVQMEYPCIVYQRDAASTKFADNAPYTYAQRYQVTLIDRNPDSALLSAIKDLPMCDYDRGFATEGLNHDVFVLYY